MLARRRRRRELVVVVVFLLFLRFARLLLVLVAVLRLFVLQVGRGTNTVELRLRDDVLARSRRGGRRALVPERARGRGRQVVGGRALLAPGLLLSLLLLLLSQLLLVLLLLEPRRERRSEWRHGRKVAGEVHARRRVQHARRISLSLFFLLVVVVLRLALLGIRDDPVVARQQRVRRGTVLGRRAGPPAGALALALAVAFARVLLAQPAAQGRGRGRRSHEAVTRRRRFCAIARLLLLLCLLLRGGRWGR